MKMADLFWRMARLVATVLVGAMLASAPASAQSSADKLLSDYQDVSWRLQKHIVGNWWIDDAPESPRLLARQWSLAGEWVAAWLEAHPSGGLAGVRAALTRLDPKSTPDVLPLSKDAFLVSAPSEIGNVFIVARAQGHFRLAWSTGQKQDGDGEQAAIVDAWLPENARESARGASSGSVMPGLGRLADDAAGHSRFYIEGTRAQSAGGTVGEQMTVWLWDGTSARLQIARAYAVMIDQAVGTRVIGDRLVVREKKFFRTFFSCGMCEERQTDWTVQVGPQRIVDLGETSTVPELDVVDELLFRVIHGRPAADVAAPSAIRAAREVIDEARADQSDEQWREYPNLGMMDGWKVRATPGGKTLCLSLDDTGAWLYTLESAGGRLFITGMTSTDQSCGK